MFPTTCVSAAPLSEPAGAGLLGVHLLATALQGQLSFQRQCLLLHLGVSPAGCLGPNLYYPSRKPTNNLIKSPHQFYGTSVLFVFKPLANSYNQDPAPL